MATTSRLRMIVISAVSALLAGGCHAAVATQARQRNEMPRDRELTRQASQDANELAEISDMHQSYLRLCPDPPEAFMAAMQRREPYVGMSLAELIVVMGTKPAASDCHRVVLSDGEHELWMYVVKHYDDGRVPHGRHALYVRLDNDVVTSYRMEPQREKEWVSSGDFTLR
jgi:hypothetical protein